MDNKTLLEMATKELFQDKDISALNRYWGEQYIQHNPTMPNGAEALKDLVPATISFETKRIIAEGDIVVTHSRATGWMDRPTIVFDIYRVKDGSMVKHGKLVEHWDIMQAEENKTVSGHTMIDGQTEIVDICMSARRSISNTTLAVPTILPG